MLLMKFDYDRPAGLRDIHVWMCVQMDGRSDGQMEGQTDVAGSSPIL